MTEKIEPMTAAEYRKANRTALGMYPGGWSNRILAALEDREANLAHARLGSLVAAIREHKMFDCIAVFPRDKRDPLYGFPDANGLTNALAHLDSLLPKEPEVAPSGFTYGPNKDWDGALFQWKNGKSWCGPIQSAYDDHIPPADAPVVAALLAGGGK